MSIKVLIYDWFRDLGQINKAFYRDLDLQAFWSGFFLF